LNPGSHVSTVPHMRRCSRYSVSRFQRSVVRSLLQPPFEWNTRTAQMLPAAKSLCVRHAGCSCNTVYIVLECYVEMVQHLKEVVADYKGLIRNKVRCKFCERDMTWCATALNTSQL
jgi:hypothetical protein